MFNEYDPFEEDGDRPSDEKVPFLVPLMMVPESEVGGGFGNGLSFDHRGEKGERGRDRKKRPFLDQSRRPNSGRRPNYKRPARPDPPPPQDPPKRRNWRPTPRPRTTTPRPRPPRPPRKTQRPKKKPKFPRYRPPPPNKFLHKVPGPPYPGPAPLAPHKPLDTTRIHPSSLDPVYEPAPPSMFERQEESPSTTAKKEEKDDPIVIVLQQPYPVNALTERPASAQVPTANVYTITPGGQSYGFSTLATTASPTTRTTTTPTPRKRKKIRLTYDNLAPNLLIDGILPPGATQIYDMLVVSLV